MMNHAIWQRHKIVFENLTNNCQIYRKLEKILVRIKNEVFKFFRKFGRL